MGFFYWPVELTTSLGSDTKVKSFSFAPYRKGYSPLEAKFPTQEHIRSDIELIANHTLGLRTYSSREGLEFAHRYIAQHQLHLTQGAWLTHNDSIEGRLTNFKEVSALIKAANEHPETIKRVIVGNEVLLRGDMDIEPLIDYIRTVKQAIKQPVSYADVWSMYLKHPELIQEVDFITIHILPYWEDEPIPVEQASDHLLNIIQQVRQEALSLGHTKPILIGETGWPAQGRQRGQAIPSPVNQASYVRQIVKLAKQENLDYNIVEAFNQPWKAKLEGKVGAHWGMFDSNRESVYNLSGPVSPNKDWFHGLLAGLAIAAIALLAIRSKVMALTRERQRLAIAIAALLSTAWTQHACSEIGANHLDILETLTVFIPLLLTGSTCWLCLSYCVDRLAQTINRTSIALVLNYLVVLMFAWALTWKLATYGRYLEFPIGLFSAPVLGLILVGLCNRLTIGTWLALPLTPNHSTRINPFVSVICAVAIAGLILGEARSFMHGRDFQAAHPESLDALAYAFKYALSNSQMLTWACFLFVMAFTFRVLPTQKSSK